MTAHAYSDSHVGTHLTYSRSADTYSDSHVGTHHTYSRAADAYSDSHVGDPVSDSRAHAYITGHIIMPDPVPTEHWAPLRLDPLLAPTRIRSWWVEHLTGDHQSLGRIGDTASATHGAGIVGWTVEINHNSRIGLTGSLDVVGDVDVDWSKDRIRIWESIVGVGEWPLGTFQPHIPASRHSWRHIRREVELIGTLQAVEEAGIRSRHVLAAGAPVTPRIAQVLDAAGARGQTVITHSTAQAPSLLSWPAGTSPLIITNEMAGLIGHQGAWVDPHGRIQIAPYVAPGAKPESWRFEADDVTLLLPDWEDDLDLSAPNVLIGRSAELEDGTVLEATVTDTNPASPTSIPRRGREVVEVIEGIEVANMAALEARLSRRLSELTAPSHRVIVQHLTVPTIPLGGRDGVWMGSQVRHVRPGVDHTALVEKMKWSSDSQICAATWRLL